MTRYGLRIVPLVFLGNREASLAKALTQEGADGLRKPASVASYLVPPNKRHPYG